jgi:hypothetical protein
MPVTPGPFVSLSHSLSLSDLYINLLMFLSVCLSCLSASLPLFFCVPCLFVYLVSVYQNCLSDSRSLSVSIVSSFLRSRSLRNELQYEEGDDATMCLVLFVSACPCLSICL